MLENEEILCLGNMHWGGHLTSKQQIMLRLARRNRILYINKPLSFYSLFKRNEEISTWQQFFEIYSRPREIEKNLFVAAPPIVFPLRYSRFSQKLNSIILLFWLKKTMRLLDIRLPIVWTYLPDSKKIAESLSGKLTVYHCVDEYSAWSGFGHIPALVRAREKELIEAVDLVIVTSRRLLENKCQFNKNCYFVPNAANFDLFSKATSPDTQIPLEIAQFPRPIIGYIGSFIADWIDIDCIEYAAKKSGYTFLFIGRKISGRLDLSKLEALTNIHFLGFKKPDELPPYLKAMDVCIMPSRKSDLNDARFPLKLFEYLSAGKPVVATDTKELSYYKNYIYLASTREEFLKALLVAVKEDNQHQIDERMALAKQNTWDARVETISELIEERLTIGS